MPIYITASGDSIPEILLALQELTALASEGNTNTKPSAALSAVLKEPPSEAVASSVSETYDHVENRFVEVEPGPLGELDAAGLPWDERIHAKTRAKKVNGHWRGRRNLDAGTLESVTAEIRAQVLEPPVALLQPAAVFETAPPEDAPPAPAVDNLPGGTVSDCITIASKLISETASDVARAAWTIDRIKTVMVNAGCPNGQMDLLQRPDLAPLVFAELSKVEGELGI